MSIFISCTDTSDLLKYMFFYQFLVTLYYKGSTSKTFNELFKSLAVMDINIILYTLLCCVCLVIFFADWNTLLDTFYLTSIFESYTVLINGWLANILNAEATNNATGGNGGGEPPRPPIVPNHPGHAQDTHESRGEESVQAERSVSYMGDRDDSFYIDRDLYTPAEQAREFKSILDFYNLRSAGKKEQSVYVFASHHPDGDRLQNSYLWYLQRQKHLLGGRYGMSAINRITRGDKTLIKETVIGELARGGFRI